MKMSNLSSSETDRRYSPLFPVIGSDLAPIVPRRGSVPQLSATVFLLRVKGDVRTEHRRKPNAAEESGT